MFSLTAILNFLDMINGKRKKKKSADGNRVKERGLIKMSDGWKSETRKRLDCILFFLDNNELNDDIYQNNVDKD